MNKKQTKLENKLGSWTDQANLSRGQAQPSVHQSTEPDVTSDGSSKSSLQEKRAVYPVARSLMDRIADTAHSHDMKTNELVGHLLTWALDQVDAGKHQLPKVRL